GSWPLACRYRCWNRWAVVAVCASSAARATRACRRSPGGNTPRSARRRPLDPPSSPTVTTAVSSSSSFGAHRRRARREAPSPCPPPNATTLTPVPPFLRRPVAPAPSVTGHDPAVQCRRVLSTLWSSRSLPAQVPMLGVSGDPQLAQPPGQFLGDGDAAVL